MVRRELEGALTRANAARALVRLAGLEARWSEIVPGNLVRARARRLLAVHSLRAADALQLAAASVWRADDPVGAGFVCFDEQLSRAAEREGFALLPAR